MLLQVLSWLFFFAAAWALFALGLTLPARVHGFRPKPMMRVVWSVLTGVAIGGLVLGALPIFTNLDQPPAVSTWLIFIVTPVFLVVWLVEQVLRNELQGHPVRRVLLRTTFCLLPFAALAAMCWIAAQAHMAGCLSTGAWVLWLTGLVAFLVAVGVTLTQRWWRYPLVAVAATESSAVQPSGPNSAILLRRRSAWLAAGTLLAIGLHVALLNLDSWLLSRSLQAERREATAAAAAAVDPSDLKTLTIAREKYYAAQAAWREEVKDLPEQRDEARLMDYWNVVAGYGVAGVAEIAAAAEAEATGRKVIRGNSWNHAPAEPLPHFLVRHAQSITVLRDAIQAGPCISTMEEQLNYKTDEKYNHFTPQWVFWEGQQLLRVDAINAIAAGRHADAFADLQTLVKLSEGSRLAQDLYGWRFCVNVRWLSIEPILEWLLHDPATPDPVLRQIAALEITAPLADSPSMFRWAQQEAIDTAGRLCDGDDRYTYGSAKVFRGWYWGAMARSLVLTHCLAADRERLAEMAIIGTTPNWQKRATWQALVRKWQKSDGVEDGPFRYLAAPTSAPWLLGDFRYGVERDCRLAMARVAAAAELFKRRTGQYPTTVEELQPFELPTPPLDPYSGKSLRLKIADGGLWVYSVNTDGVDNGGAEYVDEEHPGDLVFRMGEAYCTWETKRHATAE